MYSKLTKLLVVMGGLLIVAIGSNIVYSANSLTEVGTNIIINDLKANGTVTTTGDQVVQGDTTLGNTSSDKIDFKAKASSDLNLDNNNVTNTDAISANSVSSRNVFSNSKATDITVFKEGGTIYADGGSDMISSSTDADKVIQDAIDQTSPDGGKIFITSGNYKIDNTIKINSTTEGVSLVGAGRSTKFEVTSGTTAILIKGKANYDPSNNVEGRVVSDIYFYGSSWSERGKYAIHAKGLLKSVIKNNWFKNLRYGIKVEDAPPANDNRGNWSNEVSNNEFEVTTRPIVLDSCHDCIVSGNHSEGASTAADFNEFNDTIETRGISLIDQSVNCVVANNRMEQHIDSNGATIGYYFSNLRLDHEVSNNTGESANFYFNYDESLGNKDVRFIFSNNNGSLFWSNNKISASSFKFNLFISNHNHGRIRLEQTDGNFQEFNLNVSNSNLKGHHIIQINADRGSVIMSGLNNKSSTSSKHGVFVKQGNFDTVQLSDSSVQYFVIGGTNDGVHSNSIIVEGNHFTDHGPIIKGSSQTGKLVVNSNVLMHSSNNFVDLRNGPSIDYAVVSDNIVETNAGSLVGGGGISNLTTSTNVTGAN